MGAFDLTETQATYILDMQLRRLTRFSTIELEKEADELGGIIAGLREIVDNDAVLRRVVGEELTQVAKEFGTPRRTVLLASAGAPAAQRAPLEVPDAPCWVLLSGSGLVARTDSLGELSPDGRSAHDVVVAKVRTTAQGEFGVLTNRGRLLRCPAIELHTVPLTASAPSLQGGSLAHELWPLEPGERPLGLTTLSPDSLGLALGTRRGVVKRVNPEVIGKDAWDVIRLDDGDEVVGAVELIDESADLAFVTTDAQLLHFPASSVRPQGRSGGGMAGIKLAPRASVVFFGAVHPATDDVVTIAGVSSSLPGTEAGSAKVTPLAEYPAKGRATGGVRAHRFLKGEDTLLLAAIGPRPVVAAAASGSPVDLPPTDGRRDGSGTPLAQPVAMLAGRAGPVATPPPAVEVDAGGDTLFD
jgi:DNA gyrase subunit A